MSPWAFPIALFLIFVGRLWLRQARRTRSTGVTEFTGQWPDHFSREVQGWKFNYTMFFYVTAAWAFMAIGAVLLAASIAGGAIWLIKALRRSFA
jgi:hypothetical protein